MNRQIEFRGRWSVDGSWIYGYYVRQKMNEGEHDYEAIVNDTGTYKILSNTVGQFTGFRDIDNVKIYEDDICEVVEDPRITRMIKWNLYEGWVGETLSGDICKLTVGNQKQKRVLNDILNSKKP